MTPATPDFPAIDGKDCDALVVGAGPAGSLAARQLAASGARVLLVDGSAFPRDKVCGACLNGTALAALDAAGLGTLVASLGGIDLEALQLHLPGRSARLALPTGSALSRARLDAALADAARDAGATFLPETRAVVEAVEGDRRRVRLVRRGRGASVTARVVLVAAGIGHHCLGDEPILRARAAARSRIGAGCTLDSFPDAYREGSIFMAVGRRGYVGLVRVEDGRLNLAAAFEGAYIKQCGTLGVAAAAVLAASGMPAIPSMEGAGWHGTVPLTRRPRRLAAERLFLLGDAAGYVEPFTGEGIGWALSSALALAPMALRAIESWRPSLETSWAARHRELVGRRQLPCRVLAWLLRHPWPSRLALEVSVRVPALARLTMERMNVPVLCR